MRYIHPLAISNSIANYIGVFKALQYILFRRLHSVFAILCEDLAILVELLF